jgi:ribonuclease BN (tRNA processing enzyme)
MTRKPHDRAKSGPATSASAGPPSVTVLGCAGSRYDQASKAPCSGYLVASSAAALLVDCGPGSFASFTSLSVGVPLEAVFVSHGHRDHFGDLARFLDARPLWRGRPRFVASRATLDAVDEFGDAATMVTPVDDGERLDLGPFAAHFSSTAHQIPTLGVAVSIDGRRVVYGADTGPAWRPPAGFVGADVAILECTFERRRAEDAPFHLDALEAAVLARALGARRTVLTHVPPGESAVARLRLARGAAPELAWLAAATGLRVGLG